MTGPGSPPPLADHVDHLIDGWSHERPDLRVAPLAVVQRVVRLATYFAAEIEPVFARFGLTGSDFAVLANLRRSGAPYQLTQRDLMASLRLTSGTVSVRVDHLSDRGWVRREPDPDDGRGALISLTDRGRQLFEGCAPEHLANAQDLLAGLTDEDRDQLGRLLGKLLYTLEDPEPNDALEPQLGLVLDGAPVALEQRRAVGLEPLAGLLVRHVDPTGPAAASGIRPGDLLRTADRRPLRNRHDLRRALQQSRRSRRAVALEITRGAEPLRLRLTAPTAPADQTSS